LPAGWKRTNLARPPRGIAKPKQKIRVRTGVRELRELEPSSDDSDAIDALLKNDEETLGLIEKTAEEMEEGNAAQAKLLSLKAGMANRTVQWMAQRDGLEVCGGEK
jgi:hypothetical protein